MPKAERTERNIQLDSTDRALLTQLQTDATWSTDRLAKQTGISKTAAWNRIQKLQQEGVIQRQVAILDPEKVGLPETFFIAVKTNKHQQQWLKKFQQVIERHPEIVEVHRLAGEVDYLMKVQVASTRDFDTLYKQVVSEIDLYSVTSSLSMEVLKQETALPL
jgi:Lrp/AsnC family transcriptional regulator